MPDLKLSLPLWKPVARLKGTRNLSTVTLPFSGSIKHRKCTNACPLAKDWSSQGTMDRSALCSTLLVNFNWLPSNHPSCCNSMRIVRYRRRSLIRWAQKTRENFWESKAIQRLMSESTFNQNNWSELSIPIIAHRRLLILKKNALQNTVPSNLVISQKIPTTSSSAV